MNNDRAMREALFLKSYSDAQHTGKAEDWMTAAVNAKLMHEAALAQPDAPARVLSDDEIEAGWRRVFNTHSPYCQCDLRSFTRAARWAESAILAASTGAPDAK